MTAVNQLDRAFQTAKAEGRGVLILYLTAGYPDRETFVDLAVAVLRAGADVLEIGVPFSDPLLDGPSIQRSQQRALDQGVTPEDCLQFAAGIHEQVDNPLLFMGAYNPVRTYDLDRFCDRAANAGITGLVVPDLPYEEQDELRSSTEAHNLHIIQLVAPTSTDLRLSRACSVASGFVYCISVAGITGARSSVTPFARPLVERVKRCTEVPVAVGFGIGGPVQAREVIDFADGVIVGSALINAVSDPAPASAQDAAVTFVKELRSAIDAVTAH